MPARGDGLIVSEVEFPLQIFAKNKNHIFKISIKFNCDLHAFPAKPQNAHKITTSRMIEVKNIFGNAKCFVRQRCLDMKKVSP